MTPFIQCKKQQVPLPSSAGRLSMQHCGTIVLRLERECFSSSQVRNGVLMAWWSDVRENERCLPAKGSSINTSTQNDTVDLDKEGKKTPTHVLHTHCRPSSRVKESDMDTYVHYSTFEFDYDDLIRFFDHSKRVPDSNIGSTNGISSGQDCLSCLSRWSVLELDWNQSSLYLVLLVAKKWYFTFNV